MFPLHSLGPLRFRKVYGVVNCWLPGESEGVAICRSFKSSSEINKCKSAVLISSASSSCLLSSDSSTSGRSDLYSRCRSKKPSLTSFKTVCRFSAFQFKICLPQLQYPAIVAKYRSRSGMLSQHSCITVELVLINYAQCRAASFGSDRHTKKHLFSAAGKVALARRGQHLWLRT